MLRKVLHISLLLLAIIGCEVIYADETVFVDLGLPSGTRWAVNNESQRLTYSEALDLYPTYLPTEEQYDELIRECTYVSDGERILFTGKNGDTLSFPIGTYQFIPTDYFQNSSKTGIQMEVLKIIPKEEEPISALVMDMREHMKLSNGFKDFDKPDSWINPSATTPLFIRLVQHAQPFTPIKPTNRTIYLNLSDETKWMAFNEEGEYHYSDLKRASFRDSLPTLKEWKTLFKECKWRWMGQGYRARETKWSNCIYFPMHPGEARLDSSKIRDRFFNNYLVNPFQQDIPKEFDSLTFKARLVSSPYPLILRSYRALVDLGLPSGTKWQSYSQLESMSWEEACSKYRDQLPTKQQYEELLTYCTLDTVVFYLKAKYAGQQKTAHKAIIATGRNGNQILFLRPDVWTRTSHPGKTWGAYVLTIDPRDFTYSFFVNSKEEVLNIHLVE